MATRSEQFRAEKEQAESKKAAAKKAAAKKKTAAKKKGKGGDAAQRATYAREETNGGAKSRKSTRKSANRAKADTSVEHANAMKKGTPKATSEKSRAKSKRVRGSR